MVSPDHALVLSVDETSQFQALDFTQPITHDIKCECMSLDDKWHGTNSLFIALDTATGRVLDKWFSRHRASEFLFFLKDLEGHVPKNLGVHIILDNNATHKTEEFMKWLA